MKILKQDEIDEAAKNTNIIYDEWDTDESIGEKFFNNGAKWAESKFEEIAIDFGEFAYKHYEDSYLSFTELFKIFIEKRNEKNSNCTS